MACLPSAGFSARRYALCSASLGPGKLPVYYMDLWFAAWDPQIAWSHSVASDWIVKTLTPIWRGWSPDRLEEFLQWLSHGMPRDRVDLIPFDEDVC